jgi:hypothetical protein
MFKCTILFLAFIFLFSPFSDDPALSQDQPEAPPEAKNSDQEKPCQAPFIKELLPRAAATGDKVTIIGFGFGSSPGEVVFPGTMQAEIISWQPQRIVVVVPQGTQDGYVAVINGCSARSKDESGGHFKIVNPGNK